MFSNLGRILVLPGFCLILMGGLLGREQWNEELFVWLNSAWQHFNPAVWDPLWSSVTILGDSLVVLSIIFPLALIRPAHVWHIISAAILTTMIVQGLKFGFQMPRPALLLGDESVHIIGSAIHKRSFPSGHTAAAFVAAALLISIFDLRRTTASLLIGLASLVGVSRCMVGAHWPVDILAGAAIGWFVGTLLMLGCERQCMKPGRTGEMAGLIILGITPILLCFHRTGYPQAMWIQYLVAGGSMIVSASLMIRRRKGRGGTGEE
ncbi:MAG: phosphatase PAP2 family protein [Gammaproteobacteria bacterium]|nr:MAG: phosphatase PAP2 family protein [Gammaproteobacteria bacterium]